MKNYLTLGLLCVLSLGVFSSCDKSSDGDEKLKSGDDFSERALGLDMEMVYVQGGTFQMGEVELGYFEYKPWRTVRLDSYYIGKYEVTQAQWKMVMGTSLVEQWAMSDDQEIVGAGADYPMFYVTWEEAQEFCKRLSKITGKKYVLPTEAQWEYAARGGKKSKGYKYSGSDDIDEVAWHSGNSYLRGRRHPDYGPHRVGSKKPNELGIYDMNGNIEEYCSDWYARHLASDTVYTESEAVNPQGPEAGTSRVTRGGCWDGDPGRCRHGYRMSVGVEVRGGNQGFRVAALL